MPEQPPKAPEQFNPIPPTPPAYVQKEPTLDPGNRLLEDYLSDHNPELPKEKIKEALYDEGGYYEKQMTGEKITPPEIKKVEDFILDFQRKTAKDSLKKEDFYSPEQKDLFYKVFSSFQIQEITGAKIKEAGKFHFKEGFDTEGDVPKGSFYKVGLETKTPAKKVSTGPTRDGKIVTDIDRNDVVIYLFSSDGGKTLVTYTIRYSPGIYLFPKTH